MFETLFGSELPLGLRFIVAFLFVLALIGGAAYLVRRFGAGALTSAAGRGRQPRLGVIETAPVDGRRRLVIIRRDNVEHLVMIGGPSDVVVETNIVRAAPATSAREPGPVRAAPEPLRAAPEPMARPAQAAESATWPLQPEPVARPQRQPMQPVEEPAWPPAVAEPMPRAVNGDRLSSLASDLSRNSPGEYGGGRSPADYAPTRASDYAPARPVSEPRRAPAAAAPAPAPAAPIPAAPPPAPPMQAPPSSDEQNLADMAHRLEVALRRPTVGGPADMGMIKPVSEPMTRPALSDHAPPASRHAAPEMPRSVPEPRHMPAEPKVQDFKPQEFKPQDLKTPEPKPQEPKPQGSKSVYDSLEQEMASLLGRPSGKS